MLDSMKDLSEEYDLLKTKSEKDLKLELKTSETKEEVILDDIQKYKAHIKEFVNLDFDDVIFYLKNKDILIKKIQEYNSNLNDNKKFELQNSRIQLNANVNSII
jgi:hypothetical protein